MVIQTVKNGQEKNFMNDNVFIDTNSEDCTILYTEDLNNGQLVEGIILKNPL